MPEFRKFLCREAYSRKFLSWFLWLLGRPFFLPISYFFYRLTARALGMLNDTGLRMSGEANFLKKLCQHRGNFTLVDVGARKGAYSREVLRHVPNARIIALEANPKVFSTLQNSLQGQGHVDCINVAVGAESTERRLMYDVSKAQGSAYASLHAENLECVNLEPEEAFAVPIQTIDCLIEHIKLDKIDLLKVDVEGHELDVLQGARNSLRCGRIRCVQFECDSILQLRRQNLSDFEAVLENFELYRLLPSGKLVPLSKIPTAAQECFFFQNIIAIYANTELRGGKRGCC